MCRGFCKETQKAPPNYSAVVLSVIRKSSLMGKLKFLIFIITVLAFSNVSADESVPEDFAYVDTFIKSLPADYEGPEGFDVIIDGKSVSYLLKGFTDISKVTLGEHEIKLTNSKHSTQSVKFIAKHDSATFLLLDLGVLRVVTSQESTTAKTPVTDDWSLTEKVLFAISLPVLIPLSLVGYLIFGD